jgi:dUTP pyrophosphatase
MSMRKFRGFEAVTGYEDTIQLPTRSTKHSGAYDFYCPLPVKIAPRQTVTIHTKVKAYMQPNELLLLFTRSSGGKKGLQLKNTTGLIDSDYYNNPDNEGNIILMLRNTNETGGEDIVLSQGEKIAQGVFVNFLLADGDSLKNHKFERTGGIGSTGIFLKDKELKDDLRECLEKDGMF